MGIHTVQQAIDDLEYFAKNVKLPMPNGENLGPEKAPWILAGGSYPGEYSPISRIRIKVVMVAHRCPRWLDYGQVRFFPWSKLGVI